MTSFEELQKFFPFDETVIDSVEQTAEWQNRLSFRQLADYYAIGDGPEVVPAGNDHKAFQVLRILPPLDHDYEQARIYHLPMSLPIDPNMTMRAIRLFGADPSKQLILVGNPSAAGQKYGKLGLQDIKKVWNGDLGPTVDPLLTYLREQGITETDQIGFSYGADKAAVSSARAADHGIAVDQGVWMESAATIDRGKGLIGLARLGIDFMAAGNELENYVDDCQSPPFFEARKLSDVGMLRYLAGLARLSNIAIENSLAHGAFVERASKALEAQPDMRVSLAWGTNSELASNTSAMYASIELILAFGATRVKSMELKGMHHAGGDQIDLHAALVLQALK